MNYRWIGAIVLAVGIRQPILGAEIQFVEQFALSNNRSEVLKQLIPGTEDYYYYHCLHFQNNEQFDRVEDLLTAWIKKFKYTRRVREILNRQALLTYDQTPQKTLDHLTKELRLKFNHPQPQRSNDPNLPTTLDQKLISQKQFADAAFRQSKNLSGFHDSALHWLAEMKLNPVQRRDLLTRARYPDLPNLVTHISNDLAYQGSRGFGSLGIHRSLLRSQLDELSKLRPQLKNEANFVQVYLSKLAPSNDTNWQFDKKAAESFFTRLWDFAKTLEPTHNSLKAHILYHRLLFDEAHGNYNQARFLEYIKLPRNVGYINRTFAKRIESQRYPARLNQDFRAGTQLPPVNNDEQLVRRYLQHFFVTNTNYRPYAPYIDDTYLKHLFAETKIVNGLGDAEKWHGMLPPEKFQQLKERVDLDFAPTNKKVFQRGHQVGIDVAIKNVKNLIVKVYQVNAKNFYKNEQREINTDINLEGLVANFQQTHQYTEPPLIRKARHFEFPKLTEPGVYVIDFIGNGKSNRIVLRKGHLRFLEQKTPMGHAFTILDEKNEQVRDAAIWMGGREYLPAESGAILVPYSTKPSQQKMVITHGNLSSLMTFYHQKEQYSFRAGIHVERESLIANTNATVLIRPGLSVNGLPISPHELKECELTIESVDHSGTKSSQTVRDLKFSATDELLHQFRVPPRLSQIRFVVSGKIKQYSTDKEITLSDQRTIQINGIAKTKTIEDLHFSKYGNQFLVELYGRSGEPKSNRIVNLELTHRDFRKPNSVTLKTDKKGLVHLGNLAGIRMVKATSAQGSSHSFVVPNDQQSIQNVIHAKHGEPISIPYLGHEDAITAQEFALFEVRGNTFHGNRLNHLRLQNGALNFVGLATGDYQLINKLDNHSVRIRITEGEQQDGYVLGKYRHLEQRNNQPVQVATIAKTKDGVGIQLRNHSDYTRVHVMATRFVPTSNAYSNFAKIRDRNPTWIRRAPRTSLYASGRDIGEEYQYILDRQYAQKFPGNMLKRPALLLNPWDIRSTNTGQQNADEGGAFGLAEDAPTDAAPESEAAARGGQAKLIGFSNLDFLDSSAPLILNLKPDEKGQVHVDSKLLEGRQFIQVVALDPLSTTYRTLALNQSKVPYRDLRLLDGFSPEKHFTQQKQVSLLPDGGPFVIHDINNAEFERFDSLPSAYALYRTLSQDGHLAKFQFVTTWNSLDDAAKQNLYSEHVCHELNFFIYNKDREFFDKVVHGYLQNKKDKTFVDHWLLDDDLSGYVSPWRFQQLNAIERILLSKRLDDQRTAIARHVADTFELTPVDRSREEFLFQNALNGRALVGFAAPGKPQQDLRREIQDRRRSRSKFAGEEKAAASLFDEEVDMNFDADGAESAEAADDAAKLSVDKKRLNQLRQPSRAFKEANKDFIAGARFQRTNMLYRQLEKTKEWVENNYYRLPIEQQDQDLVDVNAFWNDYAKHQNGPFLSQHWTKATKNFTEMMFALSILDLPFEAEEPEMVFEDATLRLKLKGSTIVVHQQINATEKPTEDSPILISQNFFQDNDRHEMVDNQRVDKFVRGEFVVDTVYGGQVIVTNPSSAQQNIDVLTQIPNGAIPVGGSKETTTIPLSLSPYQTQKIEYLFYFPAKGDFEHFPVHVSEDEQLLEVAEATKFHVVPEPTSIDHDSWNYVSAFGSEDDVLTYLKTKNVQNIDLQNIAFRMKNKEFFAATIKQLKNRHVFHPTLWSYAVKHNVAPIIREYLAFANGFVNQCGFYLDSPLLTIDPVARKRYQHMEYWPLVNARTHRLGAKREILNDRFYQQYHRFMHVLACRRNLDDGDLMAATYYLLLQDRVGEAQRFFANVRPDRLPTKIQYDYFSAYLDCFDEDVQLAESLSNQYADHPVPRWRNLFASVGNLIAEIAGEDVTESESDDRDQQQSLLASREPTFAFEVQNKQLQIEHQNIEDATLNFYLMDLELLFSHNPFVQSFGNQFAHIQPNLSQQLQLEGAKTEVALPEELQNKNVLVELTSSGKVKTKPYFSNSLGVRLMSNFGQLRVTHAETSKPLSTVYVKVYARYKNGLVRFYKDGYTDLRGRFDYTSLSTNDLDSVSKFAILVMSEKNGAVVREADPPKQ